MSGLGDILKKDHVVRNRESIMVMQRVIVRSK